MAILSKRIHVYSDGTYNIEIPQPETSEYVWIRIPHDIERVDVNADDGGDMRYRMNVPAYQNNPRGGPVRTVVTTYGKSEPEVYRLDPDHSTLLDCSCQKLWRELNPDLNDKRWSSLLDGGLAWCNKTGFTNGRRNCITGENKTGRFPAFDQARLCGGAVVLAKIVDNTVQFLSMLISEPILSSGVVMGRKELWYYGTSINPRGEINYITRPSGKDSNGPNVPVRVPFLTNENVYLPVDEVHILPSGFIPPSPLWMPN